MTRTFHLISVLVFFFLTSTLQNVDLKTKQSKHRSLTIPEHKLSSIVNLSDANNFQTCLNNILVPRIVGTPGHLKVREYIISYFEQLNWSVELDSFNEKTPNLGVLSFHNIITTLNPNAERFLILACHYDSKYFPNMEFLGATDSAVPCAMMLNMAYVLKNYLDINRLNNEISLKFVFFDGEEAFEQWGPTDSIYGARHLAEKWENENVLPKIDILVLLDLLGAPDPILYSYFDKTHQWYREIVFSEERLATAGYLERYAYSSVSVPVSSNRYFQPYSMNPQIEDDHIPFLKRNVPILHIIPIPFPEVWHQKSDNGDAIDMITVENLMKIFRIFILEYLQIEV